MTITDRIEIDPKVMLGRPVIRGTRITVELILRKLSEGATEADLLDAYPRLTREDIQAAIGYAADTVGTRRWWSWSPPEGAAASARSADRCDSWQMRAVTSPSCGPSAPSATMW